MFFPNTTGMLSRHQGRNRYSESSYATAVKVACGVVHLNHAAAKTSVRSDSSASRGNAEEEVALAKILFRPNVTLDIDDKFQIAGVTLRVMKIEPRFDVQGNLDHNEVDFGALKR